MLSHSSHFSWPLSDIFRAHSSERLVHVRYRLRKERLQRLIHPDQKVFIAPKSYSKYPLAQSCDLLSLHKLEGCLLFFKDTELQLESIIFSTLARTMIVIEKLMKVVIAVLSRCLGDQEAAWDQRSLPGCAASKSRQKVLPEVSRVGARRILLSRPDLVERSDWPVSALNSVIKDSARIAVFCHVKQPAEQAGTVAGEGQ